MLLTCGVGEDSWESLGLQGDPTSPSWRKSVLGVHWKDWCWSWNCNTLATWCEELTHWNRPWHWERGRWEEKGTTEDEMVGWHHRLKGHGFEQASGVGVVQGSLVCCSSWGHKESDTTEWLNWTWQTNMKASWPDPCQVSTSGKAGWRDPNWDSAQDWDRVRNYSPRTKMCFLTRKSRNGTLGARPQQSPLPGCIWLASCLLL